MSEDTTRSGDETAGPAPPTEGDLPEPVTRSHRLRTGALDLAYTTACGLMPIRNDAGEVLAKLFYTAYTLDQPEGAAPRPLTIAFNGGPGSSSVWLHMGGLAPKRVRMLEDGGMPPPPFRLVDNECTWLTATDLVFVDPVDTGYSRATSDEHAKTAKSMQGDLEMVGEFIRLYLTRYARWTSPLFLAGESYGTFRAAGLAGLLVEQGIAFNGIVLISSVLNMQTLRFVVGNDLPYPLHVPTYAATAWYHRRLAKSQQKKPLRAYLDDVEAWVEQTYVPALAQGDRLEAAARDRVAEELAGYTGLSVGYIRQANLRPEIHRFCKEVLREDGKTVGRLDSRFTGTDRSEVDAVPDSDPSLNAIRPPFTAVLNQYVRTQLGYETDVEYHILRGLEWTYGDAGGGFADTSEALRTAFARNPYLRLFVASGYYDLATPYSATHYTLSHSDISPEHKQNVTTREYPTGHMIYIDSNALEALSADVRAFIHDAASPS